MLSPDPSIAYAPRTDATPAAESTALASVYKYVLNRCEAKKKPPGGNGGDDAEGGSDEICAKLILPTRQDNRTA